MELLEFDDQPARDRKAKLGEVVKAGQSFVGTQEANGKDIYVQRRPEGLFHGSRKETDNTDTAEVQYYLVKSFTETSTRYAILSTGSPYTQNEVKYHQEDEKWY